MVVCRRSVFFGLVLTVLGLGGASNLQGQAPPAEMPAGWQSMSVADFSQATEELFTAANPPTDQTVQAVVQHAWNTVLTDGQQIATSEWPAIETLAELIVPRRGTMLAGLEGAERDAAELQQNTQLTALHANLKARLQGEQALIANVPISEWRERDTAMAQAAMPHADRAELNAAWMQSNDWQAIPLDQQAWLGGALHVDQVDAGKFSTRWTGTIAATTTGDYLFEQLRQPTANGALKLWINNTLVIDTSQLIPAATEGEPPVLGSSTDSAAYRSQAVSLTAGEQVAIRADYVFDRELMTHNVRFGNRRFPMAVLLWETDGVEKQIVPAGAYQTPTGQQGLLGEYFQGTEFSEPAGTRTDAGLQLVFGGRAVLSQYSDLQAQILDHLRPQLTSLLANAAPAGQTGLLGDVSIRIAPLMNASERLQLLSDLAGQPQLVDKMSLSVFGSLMQHSFMLPTQDHLDLLALWGETYDPPPCRAGKYPGWGGDYYRSHNYDPQGAVANYLWEDLWSSAEYLIENGLERSDGQCNLAVVYALAIPARFQNNTMLLRKKLDEVLDDPELTGDARARWLLARKYVSEVGVDEAPGPHHGMKYLVEANLIAEDPDLRYRLSYELAAKLMSLDKESEALEVLTSAEALASTPEQQQEIADMKTYAAELTQFYAQRRIDYPQQQAAAADQAYLAELQAEQALALDRGDDAAAQRYAGRVAALEAKIGVTE